LSTLRFFKQFLAHPSELGALVPSSRDLAEMVVLTAGVPGASVVVEFGPGRGAITEVILHHLPDRAKFIAVEINRDLADVVSQRFPQASIIHGNAVDTRRYLADIGASACDCIVSGLPWAAFKNPLQDALLDTVIDVLRPGGGFATYMYLQSTLLPAGKRFKRKMQDTFSRVGVSTIVWRNLPPAIVFYGAK